MNLKPIGYFSKPHGLKGHLILFTQLQFKGKLNVIFIEQGGSQAPYFVEEMKPFNNGFLVKLETINDVNAANVLKNKEILAEDKFLVKEKDFEFLNFALIDEVKGEIGPIEGIEGTESNPLLIVNCKGKQIVLPYNPDFIVKVVKTKKQLLYRAPEGLIDVLLED